MSAHHTIREYDSTAKGHTMTRYGLEAFTRAFLEALLWSETDAASDGGDGSYPPDTAIDPAGLAHLTDDCRRFYEAHAGTWAGQYKWACRWTDDVMAGHDFAVTRNGHGAGYWDGDWSEPAATVLTVAAKAAGEVSLYRGDDGGVYVG